MIKKILFFLIPIVLVFAYGMKPKDKPSAKQNSNGNYSYRIQNTPDNLMAVTSVQLNANQISTWFRSNGSFNRNPTTGNSGFEWPKGQNKFARYASGIWIGAVVFNPTLNRFDTAVCIAEYDYEYLPGYVDDDGNPQGKDDPNYRIYNISATDTSDYGPWRQFAAPQGAYLDSLENPLLLGSQTMFYSYTDGYPEAHGNNAGSTRPLKAQILQTNWSYSVNGPLSSMAFSEFRIINRSNYPWTKCYIALWTDDDLGQATDDAVSVDTLLDLGMTYNFDNTDGEYGTAPPAVGFDYFRGPIIPGGDNDTVKYYSPPGSNNLVVKPRKKELGVTAFNMYTNGNPSVGDPANFRETYLNLQGIRKNGTPWVTPQGDTTTFAYSGDPFLGTGWNETDSDDRRFMQCSGPLTVEPGDTQSIIVGQVIARGENNLASVRSLKQADALAQRIFDNNFAVPDAAKCPSVSSYAPGNNRIYLSWGDQSERDSIVNKLSGGVYKFQGYNIYQIVPGTNGSEPNMRQLIATYDLIDGIGDIKDSIFIEQYGTYVYYTVQKGTNNGISRYIVIDKDYISNELLVSGTSYYFAVTAYYYDEAGGPFSAPKVNESPVQSCVVRVIPQFLSSGTQVNYGLGDTIYTSNKDLGVMPIVIEPLNLKTATYESVFGGTNAAPNWTLYRTINDNRELLYENVADFSGTQDTARTVDGYLMIHQLIRDSGLVPDKGLPTNVAKSRQTSWTFEPEGTEWFRGPDTTEIQNTQTLLISGRQFQSRSLGMSFPTIGTFRNNVTRVKANGSQFTPGAGNDNALLGGGPLRKIQIKFGQQFSSKAYMFLGVISGTSVLQPYQDMVDVPFSVYIVDELDSTGGVPRQVNVGFVDFDSSGTWNPTGGDSLATAKTDSTPGVRGYPRGFYRLGGYEFTYIFASSYNPAPQQAYTSRNPGLPIQFQALDVMYAWLPRLKNGVVLSEISGALNVTPYRLTKQAFVPGYPIKYSWNVNGTQVNNEAVAKDKMSKVSVYPNPYYAGSRLETDPFDRFIYFSNLPPKCTIFIYTLDGVLVRKIQRDNTDPNNSLERWDLQNANQIPVASGMYIAFIDAGSIGAKTLKLAIFSPQERIQTY